jgi:hypothetical protein
VTGGGRGPRRRLAPLLALVTMVASACGQTTTSVTPSAIAAAGASALADNAARPGEPVAEPATFHSLGVRWPVRGDANVNAVIGVHYRAAGEAAWREALALFRTDPKSVPPESHVADGWLFAGSIVDLAPDTEYEVALTLQDPDGGSVRHSLTMRTTAEPREPAGMRVRHVVPAAAGDVAAGTGSRDDPFRGLRAAQATAAPGDLFLLHAGVYAEGTWSIDHHGTAGRPIIYRSAGDGDAILDGGGRERLVSANHVRHVWLERLTLRHAEYLFVGHQGSHFVIRHCRLEVTGTGITAINGGYEESRGFVITDNVIQGPTTWPRSRGIEGVNGVLISGAGHVVAYNRMSNLGDGVHGTGHGRLAASDINNNDIDASTDDGIEGDYGDTNVRIYRNRITNAFSGISAQPSLGGPMYVFRNAIYNVLYSPFKLHNDTSGVLIFHNTSVRSGVPWLIDPAGETVNDVVTRNNLFIGTQPPALRSTGVMIRCSFDRDGYGGAGGPGAPYPPGGAVVVASRGNFAGGLEPPRNAELRQSSASVDLRLDPRSRAVDAGVRLPNFNDVFTGTGPDLGCCEVGQPLPHYGPRP